MLATSLAIHGQGCAALPSALFRAPCDCSPVHDAAGFVRSTLARLGLTSERIGEGDHEDLMLSGLEELVKLSREFELHQDGYPHPGRFNGFGARFLPRRILSVWHARSEHHRQINVDGTRKWAYYPAPVSMDAINDERSRSVAGDGNVHGRAVLDGIDSYQNIRTLRDSLPIGTPALAASAAA